MTYRELLLTLERWAETNADGALDMHVVVRFSDAAGELHMGELTSVAVDAGCTDVDALVLDAAAPDETEVE